MASKVTQRLGVVVAAGCVVAAIIWIARTYIAYRASLNPTFTNLQLAVRLDPDNTRYHLELGRLYEYSVSDIQPEKAMAEFQRVAQLDSNNPEAWIDLAAAYEFQGQMPEAEAALRRASSLAPNIPAYQWPVANFYLLKGNVDEAFRHFKIVLAGSTRYDQVIFSSAWKASGDPEKILELLIARQLSVEVRYLQYLLSHQQLDDAQAVWQLIIQNPQKFNPLVAAAYFDSLIGAHRPADAYNVWLGLQKKGLVQTPASPQANLITNGNFEEDLLNMGFAWRMAPVNGVEVGLDSSTFRSPGHSLQVMFSGKSNLDYRQVYQYVFVSPSRSYHLQAFLKTEGITTDSGPRLEVRDAYNSSALDQFSESLTGTSGGWVPVSLDFRTGPQTQLIVVDLARLPSKKLDNLISGSVWLDDVRLTQQ